MKRRLFVLSLVLATVMCLSIGVKVALAGEPCEIYCTAYGTTVWCPDCDNCTARCGLVSYCSCSCY